MSHATLAAWRAQGAHHADPVRFCYLEALARRAAAHEGEARQALDQRLAQALATYGRQLEQARADAQAALVQQVARCPQAADALQQLHAQGDFKAQHRLAARLAARADRGLLADLVRQLDGQGAAAATDAPGSASALPGAAPAPPAELHALSRARSTWTRLRVDQQISRSLARVPDNPGPLNSQLLVLRTLKLMQELSPAYLQGFMVQMETLLWLAEAQQAAPLPPSRPVRRESAPPKRKAGRIKPVGQRPDKGP